MKINFLKVYKEIKYNDILFGGEYNLDVYPMPDNIIDSTDENAVMAHKHLLVGYIFYINHLAYIRDSLIKGVSEENLKLRGFKQFEINDAKELRAALKDGTDSRNYVALQLENIKNISNTICKIYTNESLEGINQATIDSAKRRIYFAQRKYDFIENEVSKYERK